MKKKIVGLLMAVLAVCNMSMPAFAYQTQVVEEQEENQIEAEAKVYDDYLDGTVGTRSARASRKNCLICQAGNILAHCTDV